MDKRYQVFVSSTYEDLKAERQHVIRAVLALECLPAGMELFPASSDEAWTAIKRVIDESDYYVLVIAGKYGSIDPATGISYTQREFEYAVEQGIPRLAFLHRNPGVLPHNMCEGDPGVDAKLESFRGQVKQGHHVKFWEGADNLEAQVIAGLAYLRDSRPAVGWVRGDRAAASSDLLNQVTSLQQQLLEATAELTKFRGGAPVELAQGNDPHEVPYTVTYLPSTTQAAESARGVVTLTWDEILGTLGPFLLDEAKEDVIEQQLSLMAGARANLAGALLPGRARRLRVATQAFQTVKVQFVALRLMERSTKRHPVGDTDTYWTLAEYGREQLIRVRAVKRPAAIAVAAGSEGGAAPT